MDLGKPIGQQHTVPSAGFDQGEHGAGTGLSGGHGHANAHNTQSGGAGIQSSHPPSGAGGIPTGTPIADKFATGGQGQNSVAGAYAGGATDDGLTGQSNAHRTGAGVGPLGTNLPTSSASAASGAGHSSSTHGSQIPSGVSGAYSGGETTNALTGESHAQRTGAGVGPLGENLPQGSTAGAALSGTAAGAAAGAGTAAAVGTGVGPQGGAGGHYSTPASGGLSSGSNAPGAATGGLSSGTGAAGAGPLDAQRAGAQAHHSGAAAGLGAAGLGAGAAGAGAATAGAGAQSTTSSDNSRGNPVSDPKDLDHGGRHGLVFQESTGKYVHRHEVEEKK